MEEIKQLDNAEEIMNLPNSWEERGIKKEKRNIALKMLKKGLSEEVILDLANIGRAELEELKKLV